MNTKRVIVYHGGYGCETGCCGHWVEIADSDAKFDEWGFDEPEDSKFTFSHSYNGKDREFAEETIRELYGDEHVADLDWEHSVISDD